MTNLEALKNSINYPLSDSHLEKILIDRSLDKNGTYELGVKSQMELATADAIKLLVTSPNVSEGGYTLSLTEKKELMKLATSLYVKNGEDSPFEPTISSVSVW